VLLTVVNPANVYVYAVDKPLVASVPAAKSILATALLLTLAWILADPVYEVPGI
jgi:hypothetical protein